MELPMTERRETVGRKRYGGKGQKKNQDLGFEY